ncbi:hypothetical protein A9179_18095 [Pseudomonas alcaligenes]|uniref:Leucine-binding protein domain-containing protein n=1 Tax=Aquipseudomonas alcaligenes TaxID=43263 RepID=A0ABR7S403_AQUAC|nr:hypothetical protein [Pseudomonas alcaligenes]
MLPLLAVITVLLLPVVAARGEPGVSPAEIRIGMVNAQSGPAAGLGRGMKAGAEAYFARLNASGGVHGRRISLISLDDGYEPERSAAATQTLIESGNVFALFGYVGTPTSRAALPLVLRAQVPYLFPFTGATVLRTPVHRWVFNVRASYLDETEEMVARLYDDLHLQRIALLMQDDSFGEAVKSGLAGALAQRGLQIHGEVRIQRNSLAVAAAVDALKLQQPEAVFFVGTYRQLAATIKQARAAGLKTRFVTVSFIGTEDFVAAAGADGNGVYITQVMPSPYDASRPLVAHYRSDMGSAGIGYTSLEGYVGAAVFAQALQQAGPQPSREGLIRVLEKLKIDPGGFPVAFSPTDHQGSDEVFLTRVQDGRAQPVSRMQ